jgi:hypothetical protein
MLANNEAAQLTLHMATAIDKMSISMTSASMGVAVFC